MTKELPVKVLRGLRTRKRNRLNDLLRTRSVAEHGESSADQHQVRADTETKWNLAKTLQEEIRGFDEQILSHENLPEDETDKEMEEIDIFEEPVERAIAELATTIQGLRPTATASMLYHSAHTSTPMQQRVRFAPSDTRQTERLPEDPVQIQEPAQRPYRITKELDIAPEKFSGERLRFGQFRAQFESWVSRQHTSTPCEKLMVLLKYLTGDPRALVETLALTDANYQVAWELLSTNFARVDTERERILAELRHLQPRVSNPYDAVSLRKLINNVQKHTLTLEGLGLPMSSLAPLLRSSLEAALPAKIRQDFRDSLRLDDRLSTLRLGAEQSTERVRSEAGGDGSVNRDADGVRKLADTIVVEVEKLLSYLKTYVNDLEDSKHIDKLMHRPASSDTDSRHRRDPPGGVRGPGRSNSNHSTVVGATFGGKQQKIFPIRPCLFCKKTEHNSSRCPAELSHERRCEILRQQRRCVKCFRDEHRDPSECRGPRAACSRCKSKAHYTSMHSEPLPAVVTIPSGSSGIISDDSVLVLTVAAYIVNGGARIPIRIFIDNGSALTFIAPNVRRLLPDETPIERADLRIQAFDSVHNFEAERFVIKITDAENKKTVELVAYEHDFGVHPENRCSSRVRRALEIFGRDHQLADPAILSVRRAAPPAMLVGYDQAYKILQDVAPLVVVDNLKAYRSGFGYAVGGPTEKTVLNQSAVVTAVQAICCSAALSQPAADLDVLWSLERIGVGERETSNLSADEESAVAQFKEGLGFTNGRYCVEFPKKPSIEQLSNNKSVALERLEKKIRQLEKNPDQYLRYHQELMKFLQGDHAVEVRDFRESEDEVDGSYFMPHHAVITKTDAAEKWRIVFDCSSKARGRSSLNENLLCGPNLNPDLVTLLLNFRLHGVAVSADISKAYLGMAVSPRDSKLFRFVWKAPGEGKIRCFQMVKVTWGAASSGFLLAATLREHFRRADPEREQELAASFYADDFLRSFATKEEAIEFTDRLRDVIESAGMSLAKWKTNSPELVERLAARGAAPEAFQRSENNLFRVLGVTWDAESDVFLFHPAAGSSGLRADAGGLTKRAILSRVASVYDPLGLFIPFTLRGKLIIQKLWSADLQWNQFAPEDIVEEFRSWAAEIDTMKQHRLQRRYAPTQERPIAYRLHVYGDASTRAFACAAFVEVCLCDGSSKFALVMSKSRLAPRDPPSLPRLELLAALLAVRLKVFLTERMEVKFERIFLYTDSMITYYWVTASTPGRWRPYVANRVAEIQKSSGVDEWFFVAGESNIADIATRGVSAADLIGSESWWFGPSWLRLPFPERPISQPRVDEAVLAPVEGEARAVSAPIARVPSDIDLERFSSANRAIRVLAQALRFGIRARRRKEPLFVELFKQAETSIIKATQHRYFESEILAVSHGETAPANSRIASFRLFLDDEGVLRARTRLTEGPFLSYEEKNPIVIPGESRLATLLLFEAHRINAHFGVAAVLSQIRRRFWITRARQIISGLLRRCVLCRKRQGRHAEQLEGPLPPERTELTAPFAVTGLDFCGPFYVKTRNGSSKSYIALFTCSAIRAVHLELVLSMDTPQTHLAIRRFLSFYPACKLFITDNGRSFVKAATDIKRLFRSVRDKEVRELLEQRRIEWRFICPRSSWRGGFYERMVGTVKSALKKTLGRSLVDFEEFRTVIAEMAAVVNDRPITAICPNIDAPAALTPAHFIRGGSVLPSLSNLLQVDQLGPSGAITAPKLRDGLTSRTTYFRSLVRRWQREYLLQLRSANTTRGRMSGRIADGDVCLLKDDNLPRVKWELVRIVEGHPGRDGLVRTYTIRQSNQRVTRRPAQLLFPLEVVETSLSPESADSAVLGADQESTPTP